MEVEETVTLAVLVLLDTVMVKVWVEDEGTAGADEGTTGADEGTAGADEET